MKKALLLLLIAAGYIVNAQKLQPYHPIKFEINDSLYEVHLYIISEGEFYINGNRKNSAGLRDSTQLFQFSEKEVKRAIRENLILKNNAQIPISDLNRIYNFMETRRKSFLAALRPEIIIQSWPANGEIPLLSSVTLKARLSNAPPNVSFMWSPSDDNFEKTKLNDSVIVTPNTTMVYTVTARGINGNILDTETVTITVKGDAIAPSIFSIRGVIYNNISSVPSHDPPGFSQFYAALSIPFPHARKGINIARPNKKPICVRNLYIEPKWNSSGLQTVYSYINPKDTSIHVNNMDILQYSYLQCSFELNLLTWIIHKMEKDYFHIYFAGKTGLTFVKDTNQITNKSGLESNFYCGFKFGGKTEGSFSKSYTIEAGASVFWMPSFNTAYKNDLNIQLRDQFLKSQDTLLNPKRDLFGKKKNTGIINIYSTLIYNINNSESSQLFLHFNYYQNFSSLLNSNYKNSYFQFQLGYKADLQKLLNNLFDSLVPKKDENE